MDPALDLDQLGMAPGYQALLERSAMVLAANPRVQALFVVGSAGRGEADHASDLDLLVAAVDQEAAESLIETTHGWLDQITDSIYLRVLGGAVITLVTPEWKRLDLTIVDQQWTGVVTSGPALTVFDKAATALPDQPPAPAFDVDHQVELAENFLRSLGLMVSDLERREVTTLTWASEFLIQELVDLLFVEAGLARRTAKRVRSDLPREASQKLDSIPRATTTRSSIVQSHLATASLYLPLARRLIETNGGVWPLELEDSTRRYLRDELGAELPSSNWMPPPPQTAG